jgi:hypothetical protein
VTGLNVVEIDFGGKPLESIADSRNLLHKLLPPIDEQSEALLTKIDWYGDTYFNYLQLKRFLAEWDELGQRAQTPEEKELIDAVRRIAQRCQKDRSLLRFIGD